MKAVYRVVVQRRGRIWHVCIEGVGGEAGVQARDLADVEPRARKLIWSYTGTSPADIKLDVDVRLPPAIQLRMDLAAQLSLESAAETDAAMQELVESGASASDVGWILRECIQRPRAIVVSNGEIARHGLSRHPTALGLRWDDHGQFVTLTCRTCVESTRDTYMDVDPDEQNLLLYDQPFRCDCCELLATLGDEEDDD